MSNLKPLVLAAAAALTVTAHAGDKEVLDLLVKKGVITAEERAKAIQESKTKDNASNLNEVFAAQDAVKRLAISGRVQVQYEGASVEQNASGTITNSVSTSDFILRRMYLGAKADVGDGFSGELVWNFADGSSGGEFDKAVFTAETKFGKWDIGYQKVQWGQEENTSSGRLPVVERSLATRYWAESNNGRRLGFGARHTGIHYSNRAIFGGHGEADVRYGLSVVRADHNGNFSSNIAGANDLGLYGFASVEWKPLALTLGVNVAENTHSGATTDATTLDDDSIKGYNPYLRWVSGDFTILAEYIDTDVQTGATKRNPTAYNVTGIYKVVDNIDLVARYSAIDTDGRNIRVSDGLRNINGPSTNFNEADSIYLGVNYYFNGDNAKVQAGYEMAGMETANGATKVDADVFRVQVQILF
jgi:phosphate-selective porin